MSVLVTAGSVLGAYAVRHVLAPATWASSVAGDLRSGAIVGAALVPGYTTEELALATARPGCLVVDRRESHIVEELASHGWVTRADEDVILVLAPPGASPRMVTHDQFAGLIEGDEPLSTEIDDPNKVDLSDEGLFAAFSSTRLGGSSALLALSGARRDGGPARLRNPAALGLKRVDKDGDGLVAQSQSKSVRYNAVGLYGGDERNDWSVLEDATGLSELWMSAERRSRGFWLMLELTPAVDPPVWMPAGQIFEQRRLTGRQTLATSFGTGVLIAAGRITTLVVPAYCLDAHLGPPAGDPMAVTPFCIPISPGATQEQVWRQRAVARGELG